MMSEKSDFPSKDAWQQHQDLLERFTQEWKPRPDLQVTADACARSVVLGIGYKIEGDQSLSADLWRFHTTQRNLLTMRQLAKDINDACAFVEAANPRWAKNCGWV